MKSINEFLTESLLNEAKNLPSFSKLEFEYSLDDVLAEVEDYFTISDDLDDKVDEEIKTLFKKIEGKPMFGLIDEYGDFYKLVDKIKDVLYSNENVKELGEVSSNAPTVTLYQLGSTYIFELNSEQDIQYYVSK